MHRHPPHLENSGFSLHRSLAITDLTTEGANGVRAEEEEPVRDQGGLQHVRGQNGVEEIELEEVTGGEMEAEPMKTPRSPVGPIICAPAPVGPIRTKSAPPSRPHSAAGQHEEGQGADYFEEMFQKSKSRGSSAGSHRSVGR